MNLGDLLLDGRVIGRTFRIDNSKGLGELPKNYNYQVLGLESGANAGLDYLHLVARGEDGESHHFPIAFRLKDECLTQPTKETFRKDIAEGYEPGNLS